MAKQFGSDSLAVSDQALRVSRVTAISSLDMVVPISAAERRSLGSASGVVNGVGGVGDAVPETVDEHPDKMRHASAEIVDIRLIISR